MNKPIDKQGYDFDTEKNLLSSLTEALSSPDVVNDQQKYIELNQEYTEVKERVDLWEKISAIKAEISETTLLLEDPEFTEIAEKELSELEKLLEVSERKFKELTTPKLPDDDKQALLEIRAGTGGTEASLFAEEVLRMYLRYMSNISYRVEEISISYQPEGGIKEAIIGIPQKGAFGKLRFESGVHRVQRVPVTESGGRIHTSAISVAVLPQVETQDISINESDLKIESFRSSGPGGQSVNTTDSAVRITHIPTGITVSCQDGKSQHKNKEKALQVLASKLYEIQQAEALEAAQEIRTSAVKSGDRSAKIRTYNFPQGRVTDHRTKDTWYSLVEILEGNLETVVPVVNNKLRQME